MEDKIILKFKTKNILNFYEIEPRCPNSYLALNLTIPVFVYKNLENSDCEPSTCCMNVFFV